MPRKPKPTPNRTAAQAAVALPLDVRWVNRLTGAIALVVLGFALMAGHAWLMGSALFPIRQIELQGDMVRNNLPTLRANATPMLAGNFFSIDLQQSRAAFQAVPWVRHAVVRRVWPDTLVVDLEEHRPAALWEGPLDEDSTAPMDRLVNMHGEVFQANLGDVEDEALPRLAGPEGSAAQMLSMFEQINAVLAPLALKVSRLGLTHRGSWRAEMDSGAVMELGRGNDAEVLARSERFARTFDGVQARWPQALEYADLRHSDGYALRLRGVTTSIITPGKSGAVAPAPRTN